MGKSPPPVLYLYREGKTTENLPGKFGDVLPKFARHAVGHLDAGMPEVVAAGPADSG